MSIYNLNTILKVVFDGIRNNRSNSFPGHLKISALSLIKTLCIIFQIHKIGTKLSGALLTNDHIQALQNYIQYTIKIISTYRDNSTHYTSFTTTWTSRFQQTFPKTP
jgi:hypothetical protein